MLQILDIPRLADYDSSVSQEIDWEGGTGVLLYTSTCRERGSRVYSLTHTRESRRWLTTYCIVYIQSIYFIWQFVGGHPFDFTREGAVSIRHLQGQYKQPCIPQSLTSRPGKNSFCIIVSGSWLPSPPGPCPPRWVYYQLELFPPKRRSATYLESAISSLHFLEGWCTQDCSSCRQCRRGRAAQSSRPLVRLSWSPERKADCAHNLCSARPMIKGYMEHCRDVKEMHIKFVREQKQVNFVKIKWKGKGNPCLFKRHFLQRKPVLSGGGPSSLQRGKSLTCNNLVRKKNPNLPRRPGQVSHEEVFDCIERANQSCVRSNSRWRSRPASILDIKLNLPFSMES